MKDYFDVPRVFWGRELGVKIIGSPSTPWNPSCLRPNHLGSEK